jgi:hypothetical protein
MRIVDIKDLVGQDDGIKFTTSGKTFEGYVKEINDTDIVVRAYNNDINKEVKYDTYILPYVTFKGINIEWFFEGQGCDNSAIGMSGYWVNDLQEVVA